MQRAASNSELSNDVPPIVHEVLHAPGQPLDLVTRAFMESRFGHDFSNVRVHTGPQPAESARAVHACAYTVGQNVVFGEGQYAPENEAGKRLLAHELTHVVQQGSGPVKVQTRLEIGDVDSSLEREADRAAAAIFTGTEVAPQLSSGLQISRQATACGPDEFTFGEIRQWAIKHLNKPYDGSAPSGLDDAKESIGLACARNSNPKNCNCKDGSTATAKGDQDAWTNIQNATGGKDLTGGGNFMCVGHQRCGFVHTCADIKSGKRVARTTNLAPSGKATINGHTIFFYDDPRNGVCPPKPKKKPKVKSKPKQKPKAKSGSNSAGTNPDSEFFLADMDEGSDGDFQETDEPSNAEFGDESEQEDATV